MEKLVIFCKSYDRDLYRARRMAQSVQRFNQDNLTLYISVPEKDLERFRSKFKGLPAKFLTDEQILGKTREAFGPVPDFFPAHLGQQLVKLSFWRMGLSSHYLWIDSDAYFLKPFSRDDFFDGDRTCLVMHQADELRAFGQRHNQKIVHDLDRLIEKFHGLFGREGERFYFGEPPLVWSCDVLCALDKTLRQDMDRTIYDLLLDFPCEMQLYGEYCLSFFGDQISPSQPFFKVFHYLDQFREAQQGGCCDQSLARDYMGVIMQSNWTNLEIKKKNDLNRLKRFFTRQLNDLRRAVAKG